MNVNVIKKKRIFFSLIIILLIVFAVASILIGVVCFSAEELIVAIQNPDSKQFSILWNIRIPRTMAGIIAGIGLSVSGAVIQMVFGNPLASPNIIGINAGSSFAIILSGVLFPTMYFILPISAFFGAFFTAISVFFVGKKAGLSKKSIVLAGLAVNSLLNSATDLICNLNDEYIVISKNFRMGSLYMVNTTVLLIAGILILCSIMVLLLFHNELEILSLGHETATTLGLSVAKYRLIFLGLAAISAGAAISFAGPISFVGLIVPHIAKLLGLVETKIYLLASALMGALLVCSCDLIARILFSPHELPIGIILSVLGVPFFLCLLMKRRVH